MTGMHQAPAAAGWADYADPVNLAGGRAARSPPEKKIMPVSPRGAVDLAAQGPGCIVPGDSLQFMAAALVEAGADHPGVGPGPPQADELHGGPPKETVSAPGSPFTRDPERRPDACIHRGCAGRRAPHRGTGPTRTRGPRKSGAESPSLASGTWNVA